MDPEPSEAADQGGEEPITVESIFVRERNVLLVEANFTPVYLDYYLHLMQHELRYPETLDLKLKELLAFLTLHATARPWAAWAARWRNPPFPRPAGRTPGACRPATTSGWRGSR